jgi:hypothetical protein
MADKYLKAGTTGFPTEQEALVTSAGAGDAGKIPALDTNGRLTDSVMSRPPTVTSAGAGDAAKLVALDGSGKLDSTLFPAGFGEDTLLLEASENLSAGDFVSIWDDTTAKVRLADSSNGRVAHGFVLAAVTSGNNATVYGLGQVNDQLSGMTPGVNQFLGTSGDITTTIPTTAGHYVQYLGTAHSATAMRFVQSTPIVRA